MKKKNLFLGLGVAASSVAIALSCVVINNAVKLKTVSGANDDYSISWDAEDILDIDRETSGAEVTEYYESGSKVIKTDQLKNDVTIGYTNVYRYDFGGVHYSEVKGNNEGAYFNVTPIYSMTSLTVRIMGTFKLEWGWDKVGDVVNYIDSVVKSDSNNLHTFYFNETCPSYFRISNEGTAGYQLGEFKVTLKKECEPTENPYTIENGIKYERYGLTEMQVAGFVSGYSTDTLSISATAGGLTVTKISEDAFKGNTEIETLDLPGTIEEIGNNAFDGCRGITSLYIPNSVTRIGQSAFRELVNCTEIVFETDGDELLTLATGCFQDCGFSGIVTLPSRIGYVSYSGYTFLGCANIEKFALNSDNLAGNIVSVEDGVLFFTDNSKKVLMSYPAKNSRTSYTIPSDVNHIMCNDGLSYATNLTKLVINNDVDLYFDAYSADGLTNLTEIEFAKSTNKVTFYWYCFRSAGIRNLVLPTNVEVKNAGLGQISDNSSDPLNVFYEGDEDIWTNANWNSNWDDAFGASIYVNIYAYSANQPESAPEYVEGFWHYFNGVPTVWPAE